MIATARANQSSTSNPVPSYEIHSMSFVKGKSDKQLESNKKRKSKKNLTLIPQERSSDKLTGNWKPRYLCIIFNEEHFVRDYPDHAEVSKMVKTSHVSTALIDPFLNPEFCCQGSSF